MTGHGGWPLNAFLTPDGVPFYAGTYFPPEPRQRHAELARRCSRASRAAGASSATRSSTARSGSSPRLHGDRARSRRPTAELDPAALEAARRPLRGAATTPTNGGWGGAPKFPAASVIEFLLRRGEREMALHTLRADGRRRHLRPGRRRLRALLGRRALARPPLREDALRQRAARPRVPARLPGLAASRSSSACARETLDWALRELRQARGRLRQRAGRRLRGRRGQVLRLDARRGARRARRRRSPDARSRTSA